MRESFADTSAATARYAERCELARNYFIRTQVAPANVDFYRRVRGAGITLAYLAIYLVAGLISGSMPTNKPFFPDLRPVKKVITPKDDVLVRKVCKCGKEFMGAEDQTRCEECAAKKAKRK